MRLNAGSNFFVRRERLTTSMQVQQIVVPTKREIPIGADSVHTALELC